MINCNSTMYEIDFMLGKYSFRAPGKKGQY